MFDIMLLWCHSHINLRRNTKTYVRQVCERVMLMPPIEANSSRLSKLKEKAIRLRKEIPKLNGEMKKKAIETYSKLFDEIVRLEQIEKPLYLSRYE